MKGIDGADFRATLGRFATGVVVVTATGQRAPVGMAISSFTSVSLDPPLVLFCAGNESSTWPTIRGSGRFCANILAADQEPIAKRFSGPGDRYAGVAFARGATGSPVLEGAHAFLECEIADEHPAGDHTIVVARVLELGPQDSTAPLLFHRSRFGTLETGLSEAS